MKLRALRPVVAAAARNRIALPLVVLGISLLGRAMDPGRTPWRAGDMLPVLAVVIYGALIPVLVIAVASSWLRGDDTPWSWAFARPVTRARWLRTTLLVDIVTIALCVAFAQTVIGPLPNVWLGGWTGEAERSVGYGALLVAVYAGAAFAGARGSTAIGAAFHVAVLGAATMCIHAAASWSAHAQMFGPGHPLRSFSELPSVSTMTIVATLAAIAVRRTALRLPARPRLGDPTGLAAIAVALAIAFPWILATAAQWWAA